MTARRAVLLLAALVVLGAGAYAARPPATTPESRVEALASELRCPVCQGLSVRDSPAQSAREMRALIAERVAQGRSDAEIRDEFRRSYGDWIFLQPDPSGVGAVVWLAPAAALALGGAAAFGLLRGRRARESLAR